MRVGGIISRVSHESTAVVAIPMIATVAAAAAACSSSSWIACVGVAISTTATTTATTTTTTALTSYRRGCRHCLPFRSGLGVLPLELLQTVAVMEVVDEQGFGVDLI